MRTRYADGRVIGPGFWLWLSAIAIGVFLACWSVQGQPAEGMWGRGEIGIVGMTGDGNVFVLPRCKLEASDHEKLEGYAHCNTLTLMAPPHSVYADTLRGHLGDEIEIVVRRVKPRQLDTVSR